VCGVCVACAVWCVHVYGVCVCVGCVCGMFGVGCSCVYGVCVYGVCDCVVLCSLVPRPHGNEARCYDDVLCNA